MKRLGYLIIPLLLILFVIEISQGGQDIREGDIPLEGEIALTKAISLLNEGRDTEAISELREIMKDFSETIWGKRAIYLLGHINFRLRRFEEGIRYLEMVKGDYEQLTDYIELNLAKGYKELGDYKEAIKASERLINMRPPSRLIPDAEFVRAQALYMVGDYDQCISYLDNFIKRYPRHENFTEAMSLIGQVLLERSKPLEAYNIYQILYTLYPTDHFALIAEEKMKTISSDKSLKPSLPHLSSDQVLKRIDLLIGKMVYSKAIEECTMFIKESPRNPLIKEIFLRLGECYLHQKRYNLAIETFKTFIDRYPNDPLVKEALYQIASIYWNNGNTSMAIDYCQKVIDRFPTSSWAEKTLYIMARINDEEKRINEAVALYSRIIKYFPKGNYAEEAWWKIGWIYYLCKEYQKAINAFQEGIILYPDSNYTDTFLYWMGRSAEKIGNNGLALSAYKRLQEEYPYTYYAHRGKERLNLCHRFPYNKLHCVISRNPRQRTTQYALLGFLPLALCNLLSENLHDKWEENNVNISYYSPFHSYIFTRSDIKGFHLERARELIELEFSEDARKEIKIIEGLIPRSPEDLLILSLLYSMVEAYPDSISVLYKISYDIQRDRLNNLTPFYWRLFYPLPYRDYISRHVSENQVDLFLVEAIIRQESAFDINALSIAEAHGLMQLIPETGRDIFNSIFEDREFKKEMLFDPELNILLGIRHLAELLERYNGNLIFTLASYNAGMNKVDIWRERYKDADPDEFIEMIPYRETKGYVKKVLRNYQNYREIYSDEIQHSNKGC
ncbi:MAG: tetratricopeptide repeat protein [Nitrospinae bacterium]|nr:tetratricopeptide repeat protein [Nitrospinota bacterium]